MASALLFDEFFSRQTALAHLILVHNPQTDQLGYRVYGKLVNQRNRRLCQAASSWCNPNGIIAHAPGVMDRRLNRLICIYGVSTDHHHRNPIGRAVASYKPSQANTEQSRPHHLRHMSPTPPPPPPEPHPHPTRPPL